MCLDSKFYSVARQGSSSCLHRRYGLLSENMVFEHFAKRQVDISPSEPATIPKFWSFISVDTAMKSVHATDVDVYMDIV